MGNFQTPPPYNPGGNDGRPNPGGQPPYGGYQQPPYPQQDPYRQQPPYGQPPYGQPWQPYAAAPERPRTNGMGTAGFVLSLVGLFFGWIPVLGWLIWLLGAVFSFIGLFRSPRGLAIAGVVISLVFIPVFLLLIVALGLSSSVLYGL